jgi:hypothetical protein
MEVAKELFTDTFERQADRLCPWKKVNSVNKKEKVKQRDRLRCEPSYVLSSNKADTTEMVNERRYREGDKMQTNTLRTTMEGEKERKK